MIVSDMNGNKSNNILLITESNLMYNSYASTLCAEMRNMYYLRSKWVWSFIMGIFGIVPGRHCAQSAFRPAMVGIRPLLGSFHWLAFGHAPVDK